MTRVLLVRHAESVWNADGRWQGQADPPLSPRGERQAAAAVVPGDLGELWTSDLARARRTALVMAGGTGLVVRSEPLLRERDAGEWTGLTRTGIEAAWPGYLEARRRPPGFEPDDRVESRAHEALALLGARPVDVVLAVTHGGLIRTLERVLGAAGPPLANLEGRWFETGRGPGAGPPRVGERVLLLDPGRAEVTVPGQI